MSLSKPSTGEPGVSDENSDTLAAVGATARQAIMRDLLDTAWQSYGTSRYIAPAVAALVWLLSLP